jgi:hypothetical protein
LQNSCAECCIACFSLTQTRTTARAARPPSTKVALFNLFKKAPKTRIKLDTFIAKHAAHVKPITVLTMMNDLKNPKYAVKDVDGKPELMHIVKDDDGTLYLLNSQDLT